MFESLDAIIAFHLFWGSVTILTVMFATEVPNKAAVDERKNTNFRAIAAAHSRGRDLVLMIHDPSPNTHMGSIGEPEVWWSIVVKQPNGRPMAFRHPNNQIGSFSLNPDGTADYCGHHLRWYAHPDVLENGFTKFVPASTKNG